MSITRKINPHKFKYSMDNKPLDKVSEFKDLGIIVTDNLSWDAHIGAITKKANRNLWLIKRMLGYQAPIKAKKILYVSLVRSLLEYGSQLWNSPTTKNLRIIESVQRRATKYILNDGESTYKSRLTLTNLIPLSYRRELLDLSFIHPSIHGHYGRNFKDMFLFRQHRCTTRSAKETNMIKPSSNLLAKGQLSYGINFLIMSGTCPTIMGPRSLKTRFYFIIIVSCITDTI